MVTSPRPVSDASTIDNEPSSLTFVEHDDDLPWTSCSTVTDDQIQPSRPEIENRKSSVSIRRKPVPLPDDTVHFEPADLQREASRPTDEARISTESPTYILPVDPPESISEPPSYPYPTSSLGFTHVVDPVTSFTSHTTEYLPRYAEETQTEPKTLARGLWRWGWICPLLWLLGMFM